MASPLQMNPKELSVIAGAVETFRRAYGLLIPINALQVLIAGTLTVDIGFGVAGGDLRLALGGIIEFSVATLLAKTSAQGILWWRMWQAMSVQRGRR